ncbi:hypothetical protein FAZ19_04290 [Sphingobacterium alkalisoli]|uniref:Uncharacterized protein n=1 Tax=Sphingobacterium alkalisoli TaxID=1874115 RepID=A0A4U0H9F1_9SPHI|nr:hypothetical protein [Sphingobacterium alkalisoli]TJY68480.1 hypothetical protein FAZ19_04290 [Sphingobacterium alkalisoli]
MITKEEYITLYEKYLSPDGFRYAEPLYFGILNLLFLFFAEDHVFVLKRAHTHMLKEIIGKGTHLFKTAIIAHFVDGVPK